MGRVIIIPKLNKRVAHLIRSLQSGICGMLQTFLSIHQGTFPFLGYPIAIAVDFVIKIGWHSSVETTFDKRLMKMLLEVGLLIVG